MQRVEQLGIFKLKYLFDCNIIKNKKIKKRTQQIVTQLIFNGEVKKSNF